MWDGIKCDVKIAGFGTWTARVFWFTYFKELYFSLLEISRHCCYFQEALNPTKHDLRCQNSETDEPRYLPIVKIENGLVEGNILSGEDQMCSHTDLATISDEITFSQI